MTNREIDQYIKNIKLLMPISSKKEKRFLEDMADSIQSHFSTNPTVSYNDIVNQFGMPEQVVCDYISSQDSNQLTKQLCKTRMIKRVALVVLSAVLIGYFIFLIGMHHKIETMTPTEIYETIDIITYE